MQRLKKTFTHNSSTRTVFDEYCVSQPKTPEKSLGYPTRGVKGRLPRHRFCTETLTSSPPESLFSKDALSSEVSSDVQTSRCRARAVAHPPDCRDGFGAEFGCWAGYAAPRRSIADQPRDGHSWHRARKGCSRHWRRVGMVHCSRGETRGRRRPDLCSRHQSRGNPLRQRAGAEGAVTKCEDDSGQIRQPASARKFGRRRFVAQDLSRSCAARGFAAEPARESAFGCQDRNH